MPFRIEDLPPKIITFQRMVLGDDLVMYIRINLQIFLKFPIMNRLKCADCNLNYAGMGKFYCNVSKIS